MTTGECKNALAKWFSIEPAPAIATALLPASRRVREIAIRLRPDLTFTDLLPLIENDFELYGQVDRKLTNAPLSLMVQAVESRGPWFVGEILTRVAHGTLSRAEVKPHVAMLRAQCSERLDEIEAIYEEIEGIPDDHNEYGRLDLDEEKQHLESLIAELDAIWSR
jgi:hypothetical protein